MISSSRITRVQGLWVRLATQRAHRGCRRRHTRTRTSTLRRSGSTCNIPVKVINAVTGETHSGIVSWTSKRKFKRWLSHENNRAQVDKVIITKKSTWWNLPIDKWANYPILLKVDKYQVPYIIDHIGTMFEKSKQKTCPLFLKTINNIGFINQVTKRKNMVKTLVAAVKKETLKSKNKKNKGKKVRRRFTDFDDV